jgi:hypothetical protein
MRMPRGIVLLALGWILMTIELGHACGNPPDIYISAYEDYINPGGICYFRADRVGGGSVSKWWWTPDGSSEGVFWWSEEEDYSTGACSFSSLGEHYVWAHAENDDGNDSDWARVWVLTFDLDIPADYVAVGGLVPVNLSWSPGNIPGCFELKTTTAAGGNQIKVWKDSGKTTLLISEATWSYVASVSGFPHTVWIEAVAGGLNATLSFNYRPSCSQPSHPLPWSEDHVCVTELKIVNPCDLNTNGLIDDPYYNEFSFTAGDPATLQVGCQSLQCVCLAPQYVLWTIEDIGTIRATWYPHVPGNVYIGQGYSPIFTFTGMPANNSDFGRKVITLYSSVVSQTDQETIEVFFEPVARNNPGPPGEMPPDGIAMEDLVP